MKIHVSGLTVPSEASVQITGTSTYSSMEISIGIKEVITALDDILSDEDMVSDEDLKSLVDKALEILTVHRLRDATHRCMNCDDEINCANCDFFAGNHG